MIEKISIKNLKKEHNRETRIYPNKTATIRELPTKLKVMAKFRDSLTRLKDVALNKITKHKKSTINRVQL